MSKKTLDLNAEEKKTPDGNGQPENNTSKSSEELENEIDKVIEEEKVKGIDYEEYEGDKVIVSKSEMEKMHSDKENYKKGLLSVKGKIKEKKTPAKESVKDSDVFTKSDFYKVNEEQAIAKACKNPEIDKNWEEVIKYYTPRRGKSTPENIVKDIDDAFTIFQKHHKSEEEGDNKKVVGDLATDEGKSHSEKTGDKKSEGGLKIPQKTNIQDWYKDKKE